MRVLSVLTDWPVPPVSGLHHRMMGTLALVESLGHESHALVFSVEDAGRDESVIGVCDTASFGSKVHYGGCRLAYDEIGVTVRALLRVRFLVCGLASVKDTMYPFSIRYDAVFALERLLGTARSIGAEVVILPSVFVHWVPRLRREGLIVIADAADVLTEVTRLSLVAYSGRNPVKRLGLYANWVSCRSQESLFLRSCDEIWCTSEGERLQLQSVSGVCPLLTVPNAIGDPGRRRVDPEIPIIGFLGNFSYRPNLEAARTLVEDIFPRIRHDVPSAVLRLGGADLPDSLRDSWRADSSVELVNPVISSAEFFSHLSVVALPISLRGGVPLKLVESLSLGVPIVAYPAVVKGLPLVESLHLDIAATPQDFASAVVRLLRSADRRQMLAVNGREAYERLFSYRALLEAGRRSVVLGAAGVEPRLDRGEEKIL